MGVRTEGRVTFSGATTIVPEEVMELWVDEYQSRWMRPGDAL